MPRIRGANSFHLAKVEENTEELYKAGTPKKTERLTSIAIDSKVNSESVYSDDEVEEDVYGAIQVTGKVGLNYLTNETKLEIFGGEIDADGVYYPPADFEVKHHAMLFKAPTTGNGAKYVCYYDIVFELPSFKAESAEDKPKTQSIELSFKGYKNRQLKTHYADLDTNSANSNKNVADNWFKQVRTQKATVNIDNLVILDTGSLGTAGDTKITGLTSGKTYKVTSGSNVKYTDATGALVTFDNKAALGTSVTSITGLVNGTTYKVEEYTI